MFAWRMTRPINLFGPFAVLPLVGLGPFAAQSSITRADLPTEPCRGGAESLTEHLPQVAGATVTRGFRNFRDRQVGFGQ